MEYKIDECAYGKYCMCATCSFQNDCSSNCADCMSNNKQIHDIWSCTKYMRKEHLRKGTDDEYERAVEQMEYDTLYEPTYNPEDGSM